METFKYLPPDRVDVLESGHIRFTPPGDFNDPFEAFPYFKSMHLVRMLKLISKKNGTKKKLKCC